MSKRLCTDNLKIIYFDIAEFNLKGNKLADKRLMKLVDQCRTKQILDYIREHCPTSDPSLTTATKGKGKKGKKQEEPELDDNICDMCHSMMILHVEDDVLKVRIDESQVGSVRPYILCCIINDLKFTEASFKKFIQLQSKLHDTVCDKRNVGTIATHDLKKIPPGKQHINDPKFYIYIFINMYLFINIHLLPCY